MRTKRGKKRTKATTGSKGDLVTSPGKDSDIEWPSLSVSSGRVTKKSDRKTPSTTRLSSASSSSSKPTSSKKKNNNNNKTKLHQTQVILVESDSSDAPGDFHSRSSSSSSSSKKSGSLIPTTTAAASSSSGSIDHKNHGVLIISDDDDDAENITNTTTQKHSSSSSSSSSSSVQNKEIDDEDNDNDDDDSFVTNIVDSSSDPGLLLTPGLGSSTRNEFFSTPSSLRMDGASKMMGENRRDAAVQGVDEDGDLYPAGEDTQHFRPETTLNPQNVVHDLSGFPTIPDHNSGWNQDFLDALHEEVMRFDAYVRPTEAETVARADLEAAIAKLATELWPNEPTAVTAFGSSATGLALPGADMDVVVNCPASSDYQLLSTFNRAMERAGILMGSSELISHARVPIIKAHARSPPVDLDVSFNQPQGVTNSRWVAEWMRQSPYIRPIALIAKALLRQWNLHEPFSGGMGSYTIFLLVASFFQNYPMNFPHRPQPTNLHWEPSSEGNPALGELRGVVNAGQLLLDFLWFYGVAFNSREVVVCTKKAGYKPRHEVNVPNQNPRYPSHLIVEDPVTPHHFVGMNCQRIETIKERFKQTLVQLSERQRVANGPDLGPDRRPLTGLFDILWPHLSSVVNCVSFPVSTDRLDSCNLGVVNPDLAQSVEKLFAAGVLPPQPHDGRSKWALPNRQAVIMIPPMPSNNRRRYSGGGGRGRSYARGGWRGHGGGHQRQRW